MKATTALNKICGLKKRIWAIQGGQGAGKTYSILIILINHCLSIDNQEVFIASDELSKMRITIIKDFLKIMKMFHIFNKSEFTDGTLYRFQNGSFIKFIGLDKIDIGKGLRSDVIYINEANKTDFETYREITSRAKRIIIDFNPNRKFWAHEEVIPRDDCDFINLTFLDNEYLSEEEKNEILLYYEKGYNKDGTIKNEYWANMWRVYGLGEIGSLQGAIFNNWKIGEFDETLHKSYGLDFGSNDPDAMVEVAINEKIKTIYVRQKIYKNNLSTIELLELIKNSIEKDRLIIADSSGKRTIEDLRLKGFNIKRVIKNQIIDDIKLLQCYTIIVTADSVDLIDELQNYVWLDKKSDTPIDKNNHLIDAIRYVVQTLTKKPTINIIRRRVT